MMNQSNGFISVDAEQETLTKLKNMCVKLIAKGPPPGDFSRNEADGLALREIAKFDATTEEKLFAAYMHGRASESSAMSVVNSNFDEDENELDEFNSNKK